MRRAVAAVSVRLGRSAVIGVVVVLLAVAGASQQASAADVTGTITPGGAPVTATTTGDGDNIRLTFAGNANQRVFVKLTGVTIGTSSWNSLRLSILNPDGSTLGGASNYAIVGTDGGYLDRQTLPSAGTYTVLVDPQGTATGSATVTLYDVPADPAPLMTPTSGAGSAETFVVTTPGQNVMPTFAGTAGQRVSVKLSGVTIGPSTWNSMTVRILTPDGSTLGGSSSYAFAGTDGGYLDRQTLPSAGTYTVLVDPNATGTGSVTVTLYDVPADPAPLMTPTSGAGSAETFAVTTPGQNVMPTFAGTAGQRISVKLSGVTIGPSSWNSMTVRILTPDGQTLGGSSSYTFAGTDGGFLDRQTLPSAGTYTVLVDPNTTGTGSVTVTLYDVPADPAPLMTPTSGAGSAQSFVVTTPGQNVMPTFAGAVGQRISVKLSGVTIGPSSWNSMTVRILKPDGQTLGGSSSYAFAGTDGGFLDRQTLPSAGTYTVLVDPNTTGTGNLTVTLYDVPADPAPTLAVGGESHGITTTTPGQNARPTFTGIAGQPVKVIMTGVTIGSSSWNGMTLRILKPDGSTVGGSGNYTFIGTDGGSFSATLPVNGTYAALVDPNGTNTGSATIKVVQSVAYQPLAQTRGSCDDGGIDFKSPCATVSDPVNSLTGAFTTSVTDASVPGSGVPFEFTRSYDSADATQGRLGPGWTDSLSASLTVEANGDIVSRSENGQQGRFARQADGSFVGAAGARSTLSAISGGYELVRHDQVRLRFDMLGKLTSVKDHNDEGLTLSYAADGKLQSVTDSAARSFGFAHNAEGLLSQVSLPDGRSVSYAYTAGRPTSVTDVSGGTTTYRYDPAGRLDKITDQSGRVEVENTYGADGRVTAQLDGLGNSTTFAWDAGTQTATITDPRGNVWKDVYSNNVLVKRIDALGQETVLSHNASLDQTGATSPNGEATTMSYDSRGNLTQAVAPASLQSATKTMAYDADNNVTSIVDARGKVTSYGYDAAGNNTTVTQDGQTVATYTYDSAGRVLTTTDGRGNSTGHTYDADGNLASVTDPLGNKTTYTYDGAGRMLTRVDPLGNVAGANPNDFKSTWTYDAAGRVLTESDPLGNTTTFTYDAAGNKLTEKDANNKTTTYIYDAANRLTSTTAPDGGVTSYTYDAVGSKLTETNPRNHTTTYTYDSNNRLASVTTPLGNKTTYSYDADGNQTKAVEPRGNVAGANPDDYDIVSTYDAAGRLLTETNPLGHTTTYTYDKVGNRLTVTDPRGKVTTNAYDARNRLLSVTTPDGGGTLYSYDGNGNQLTRTDPRGKVWTSTYDLANRLASSTTPLGKKTTYTYDANGRQTKMVEPRGNVSGANPDDYATVSTYDRAGRLLTSTDPLGNQTTTAYDAVGNKLSVTDAASRTTSYTYDPVNRLASVIAADLTTTSYAYDLAGNRTSRTDGNNRTTTYAYDADGRRTTVTSPIGQTWTTSYDAAGNVVQAVDANGNSTPTAGDGTTTNTYDGAGRHTATDYSDSTPDVTFAYDAAGNRTTMTDGTGTETRAYDDANRLTNVSRGADAFTYVHDLAGNITRRTYPDGAVTDYTFDDDSRMLTVTSSGATTGYSYDAAGHLTTTTLPAANGYVEDRTYDRAGRLTRIRHDKAGATLVDFTYTLDAVGNPTQVIRSGSVPGTRTYAYDSRHRLTEVCYAASCAGATDYIRWTYDSVSNRLSEVRPTGSTSYTYNDADQLTLAGSTSYTYDANGNQIAAGARTFAYDLADRMTSTANGGTTTSYSYDGNGSRQQAVTGAEVVTYQWDLSNPLPQLALERDAAGAMIRRYLYGLQRLAMVAQGNTSYYHADHLKSVADITSSAGDRLWSYDYEPYGNARTELPHNSPPANVHKFAGELEDGTGLYHLRARQLDPANGRFLGLDPLEPPWDAPAFSSYGYVEARPTVLVDPSGMGSIKPDDTAVSAVRSIASVQSALQHPLPRAQRRYHSGGVVTRSILWQDPRRLPTVARLDVRASLDGQKINLVVTTVKSDSNMTVLGTLDCDSRTHGGACFNDSSPMTSGKAVRLSSYYSYAYINRSFHPAFVTEVKYRGARLVKPRSVARLDSVYCGKRLRPARCYFYLEP